MNKEAIYKMAFDCGRQGSLEGVFVADKNHVKILLERPLGVYFGEVLGKHSEICGTIEDHEITLVTDDPAVVGLFNEHKLSSGFNPFYEQIFEPEEESWQGLEVWEVVEKIENEQNGE